MSFLLVGMAGIIGALMRYFLGVYFSQWWFHDFPLATFIINLTGCFFLGWFTNLLPRFTFLHPYVITAICTGLIGSFTTFSTFSVETIQLLHDNKWGTAIFYVLLSVWGGLLLSWVGYRLGLKDKNKTGKVL